MFRPGRFVVVETAAFAWRQSTPWTRFKCEIILNCRE